MKWFGIFLATLALAPFATAETAVAPRIRTRFDDNWRFRRDPLPNVKDGNFDWSWKVADDNSADVQQLPSDLVRGEWHKVKAGRDVFRGRRGYVWYRTELGSGVKPKNLSIHFEQVDDNALIFLNGQRIIGHKGWSEPFDVAIGANWNPQGPNELVVLVQNEDGPGGITGPVYLQALAPDAVAKEAMPGFNDRAWRIVHLPHDFVVEGAFTPTADTSHGSLPVTTAWYRKTFTLPAAYKGKSLWIDFDGVYRDSTVYLNGHKLGHWASGYAGFRFGLNRYANFGGRNVLAVHVDPRRPEGWWYEGGGIYRHVWLNVADPVHVRPWGTFAHSDVKLGAQPSAAISVAATVDNTSGQPQMCVVKSEIVAPSGRLYELAPMRVRIAANSSTDISSSLGTSAPELWSIEKPQLYHLRTTVLRDGRKVDEVDTAFGLRSIYYDPNQGFFLNGKRVELKGTCNHQDHAGVGIALPDSLIDWRIKKLKEMGSNAYRCSHNPPAAELLDACDRQGMVVMDETRHLGDTESPKSGSGTGTSDLSELRSLILRDRNHPSVIMWSLFNEEGLQGTDEGAQIFTAMRDVVRKLDPTRPCTGAMNGGWGTGITLVEDLQGFNYGIGGYDRIHAAFPDLPMYGSETASTVSTRGIYANDTKVGYVSAYDVNKPGWGATAEESWSAIAKRTWMAGEFVWTGFDYKGEPTPYGWPCINSHFGIMDICGFPKDNFFYYQAMWGDKPMVHILPHWNWAGKEGKPIDVWVYTNGTSVELSLNGKSLGKKDVPKYGHASWNVPYQPGWLIATSYRNGKVIAREQVATTGAPAAIRLRSSVLSLAADGEAVSPVEVEIVDAKGRVVPTASNLVTFKVTGAGVVGVGNGDPSSHEPDKATRRHAFNGLCMALVGGGIRPGRIIVTATSPGLRSASIILTGEKSGAK